MEYCKICGCIIHSGGGDYAQDDKYGRSHATKHHLVAERFFGRTKKKRTRIFAPTDPWELKGESVAFCCYDCHEELLHNPVLLPEDIKGFAELVKLEGFDEKEKTESRVKIAKRIELFHEVIAEGIKALRGKKNKALSQK